MKTIKITLLSILLATGLTVKAFAGASDFEGFYIGIQGSAVGAMVDGKHTEAAGNSRVTKGTAGAVSPTVGIDVGFSKAISDSFFIALNLSHNPVDADFNADDAANADDVKVTLENMNSISIEPSISLSDNTAIYLSVGYSEFDLKASGTGLDATQSFTLEGTSVGLGSKSRADNGMFIKSEAGVTDYDSFKLINVGTADGTVEADATFAYGKITVGMMF